MKINWPNVVALLLAVTLTVVLIRNRKELAALLGTVTAIGPGHSTDEMTLGLITLGIIGVCLVAIVKILNRRDPK